VVRGWINYYGRFYASELYRQLNMINVHLVRWVMHKYKRFRSARGRAWKFLADVAARDTQLFAHWPAGPRPGGRVARAG
jgi:RNA-directed DNA polymerase